MAYQIKRKQRVVDAIELQDETGKVCHTIAVDLDFDDMYDRLNKARNQMIRVEKALRDNDSDATREQYGESVCVLFELIFGADGANVILKHYDSRYFEMVSDVFPYIIDEIYPRLDALSKEKTEQMRKLRDRVERSRRKSQR